MFSLGIYTALVLVLLVIILFLTVWLGEKKDTEEKLRAYECGVIPTGTGAAQLPGALLPGGRLLPDFRCGGGLHLHLGRGRKAPGMAGLAPDELFHHRPVDQSFLPLAKRRAGLGPQIPQSAGRETNPVLSSVDLIVNWSRQYSLWPLFFGLSCCFIEVAAVLDRPLRPVPVRGRGPPGLAPAGGPPDHLRHAL